MNHGLKVNNNVLEITLPDGIDIEQVVVNGKSFHETKRQTKRQATIPSDRINRKDAIKSMANAIWHYPNELYTSLNCFENCQELAERGLSFLPSEERKKGKWIYSSSNGFKCSECGGYLEIGFGTVKMNFCPNCGADMRGEQDETNKAHTL